MEDQETQTEQDQVNKLTEEQEKLFIAPTKKKGWSAPLFLSGRKQSKRSASPLIQKLNKVKIADEGKEKELLLLKHKLNVKRE